MDRVILHCDCNGFYASVETVLNPELCSVPMAVCGDPKSRHGIILAKNELAKKYGIKTAETIWQAKRKCPDLVLVLPHHDEYKKYSKQVNLIYQRYTDMVEPFGIDESWLDVTGSQKLFGSGEEIAARLRREVREETGLTISVGVSFNKVFAKLGSDYKKPDATTVINRENWQQIVWPLPVESLLYVGESAKRQLGELYIKTIGDLAQAEQKAVVKRLGKLGSQLFDYANGIDESPVRRFDEPREIKSVGNGITFSRDLVGYDDAHVGIASLCDEVATRLRKHGLCAQTIQLHLKDTQLKVISRQKPLKNATALSSELAEGAMELLRTSYNGQTPIRMITITVANLISAEEAAQQLSFFEQQPQKREKLHKLENAIDSLREKYGRNAVSTGAIIGSDIGLSHSEDES